jgi:hypothetical protein
MVELISAAGKESSSGVLRCDSNDRSPTGSDDINGSSSRAGPTALEEGLSQFLTTPIGSGMEPKLKVESGPRCFFIRARKSSVAVVSITDVFESSTTP